MPEQTSPADPAVNPLLKQFVEVAPLYDKLMHDVPYPSWMRYLKEHLDQASLSPTSVLDLACGTGNVSELLAREGHEVVGADISEAMIAAARDKAAAAGLPIRYSVQDAAELSLPGCQFDLCVSLFDSLNYVLDPERLQMAFARVFAHLRPGGLFLFDMNSEYALMNHFFDQSNRAADAELRYDWVSEYYPETRRCRIAMQFWHRQADGSDRKFHEEHWQFAYREEEVAAMLERAGFTAVRAYQAYTLRPAHRLTDRIFYSAKRP
ncbi:MAG TPA: class I SAM-dependent methyltransferase [Chthonomonadaceae bacterium]|nr:class I SAM-dependent methyltransferase [Chthonomonadaceae bacterium]